jgi:N-methylhydantoinase A
LSTLGFLSAATSIDVVRSSHAALADIADESICALFEKLEAEGEQLLKESGVSDADIWHERSVEMRFIGQGNEIEVPVPAPSPSWKQEALASFALEYERKFGDVAPQGVGVEILTWRVRSSGPEPDAKLRFRDAPDAGEALKGHRMAYFPQERGYVQTPVYDRHRLAPGLSLAGPALIEERESTLVVPPASVCTVAEDRSIFIDFNQGSTS